MAQTRDSFLNNVAQGAAFGCKTGTTQWFEDNDQANTNLLGVFPYSAGFDQDGWTTGVALYSTDDTAAGFFPASSLCIVGVSGTGIGMSKVYPNALNPGQIRTMPVNLIDADEAKWKSPALVAVYKNRAVVPGANQFGGFMMIGNGLEGQGYFADVRQDLEGNPLTFNYSPGDPWQRGMAVFNNNPTQPVFIGLKAIYSDGSSEETARASRATLNAGNILSGAFEALLAGFDTTKEARVIVTAYNSTANDTLANPALLMGFAFFGDGYMGMGYTGTN